MPSNHLKDHIAIIAKHEEDFLGTRTTPERVADLLGAFVGSLGFVALNQTSRDAFKGMPRLGRRQRVKAPWKYLRRACAGQERQHRLASEPPRYQSQG
jgi:hypothetical protein